MSGQPIVAKQPGHDVRNKLESLEKQMLAQPQVHIETTHRFAKGLYAREIFIPKDTVLTGKIHKFEHLNIISKGDITVLTEAGLVRLKAPCSIVTQPGSKRIGFAHEDTVWTTIHALDDPKERDVKKLEEQLTSDTFENFEIEMRRLKELICLT